MKLARNQQTVAVIPPVDDACPPDVPNFHPLRAFRLDIRELVYSFDNGTLKMRWLPSSTSGGIRSIKMSARIGTHVAVESTKNKITSMMAKVAVRTPVWTVTGMSVNGSRCERGR